VGCARCSRIRWGRCSGRGRPGRRLGLLEPRVHRGHPEHDRAKRHEHHDAPCERDASHVVHDGLHDREPEDAEAGPSGRSDAPKALEPPPPAASLPTWAIPAALGVVALVLLGRK